MSRFDMKGGTRIYIYREREKRKKEKNGKKTHTHEKKGRIYSTWIEKYEDFYNEQI